uniref:Pbp11 protein n=1 Tax=Pyrococcus abyssi (strain GE5 / Orsay) TaxID=272844 RepID=UPI001D0F4A5A|nr:Chain A, Pbp11 protein [Pyrococcus abyssi GE5]7ANU_B Chain B, Pbp11 protein [Pyrococcus abyssi GE5]
MVGKVKVENILIVGFKTVIICEVLEGMVKVGYKVRKGKKVAGIVSMEREHKKVEFAIPGDKIGIMLEKNIGAEKGDILEVFIVLEHHHHHHH